MSLPIVLENTANVSAPAVLLDYQKEWIGIRAPLKVGEKSRRIGLTWAEAADNVLVAAAEKPAGGQTVYYLGYNQDMTVEYIQACAMWCRAFIDFTQAANVTGAGDFFKGLAEWWDKQVSKAVVGQTMSTDDGSSMAQAKVHNEVRLDLLQADAKAESNTLNRYFVRPWCDLNFAPGRPYPRLIIDVPQPEDTKLLVEALGQLIPLGLKVEQSVIRDKLNLPAPAEGAELLGAPAPAASPALAQATNSEQVRAKPVVLPDIVDNQVRTMELAVGVHLDDMVEQIKELLDSVNSLEEFRDRLIETYPAMTTSQLADAIADGLAAASLAGRDDILRGL